MDQSFDDKEYKKCKFLIKSWEHKFRKCQKRIPTKEDIKIAPSSVKNAYRIYWLLKTSALEESILSEEDGEDLKVTSKNLTNNCHETILNETKKEETSLNINSRLSNEDSQNSNDVMNKETVWGNYLKKKNVKDKEIKIKKSSSFQFTEKLFKGTNFKIRNPRSVSSVKPSKLSENCVPVDENSQNCVSEFDSSSVLDESTSLHSEILNFETVKSIKITGGNSSIFLQPISILQKVENLADLRTTLNKNKLNDGWLERCDQKCNLNGNTDICKDVVKDSNTSTSDEDYVYSSGDEAPSKTINNLSFNFKGNSSNKLDKDFQEIPCSLKSKEAPSFDFNKNSETSQNLRRNMFDVSENAKQINENNHESFKKHKSDIRSDISKSSDSKILDGFDDKLNATNVSSDPNLLSTNKSAIELRRSSIQESPMPLKKLKTDCGSRSINRKEKILQEKIRSGKANQNFVSINIAKKKFCRYRKNNKSFKQFKQDMWKKKKQMNRNFNSHSDADINDVAKCYRCNDIGHFAHQCKRNDCLLPQDFSDEEESPFPTLEEASEMIKEKEKSRNEIFDATKEVKKLEQFNFEEKENVKPVTPLYACNEDETTIDTPKEVFEVLKRFGYSEFRPGQEKAIMRILSGESTLVISTTGSGKSLCYQIPAYLYARNFSCISLVISPLVSLMEDQVINFPKILKAACYHTNQTCDQRDEVIKKLQNNEISVLLVSPEALISGERGILGRTLIKNCPSIAFACIDEVHCVSEWSHNFRTSYLMICKILKERFEVKTLLGLTATASKSTISCVMEHLGISSYEEGIIQDTILPENLILSVSKDENKENALISLLSKAPFNQFNSIIVYCIRRVDCERLASFIRTSLQNRKSIIPHYKRGVLSNDVEPYHAGLSASRRKKIQKSFMSGKLRIVVATVAFGMGINKADIRGIIHYNMPRSFEHYVQEIGRAGRDGLSARCHLFLNSEGNDLPELKRHIYANSVDRYVIRKLLQEVFVPCMCADTCKKHEVAFSIENTVKSLDVFQENISTLLCYLELLPNKIIEVLPPTYITSSIKAYGTLEQIAKKCPVLAFVIAQEKSKNPSNVVKELEFSVIELANEIGWKSNILKNELKRYEWMEVNNKPKKSGINVNFSNLGFHIRSPGNLTGDQLDSTLDVLHSKNQHQENNALYQLEICHQTFESVAYYNVENYLESEEFVKRSDNLKEIIQRYFIEENQIKCDNSVATSFINEEAVISNIHRLISSHKDCNFTGRSIAKIFYGIESPNFSALTWSRSPLWRCALHEDFNLLVQLASRKLLKLE